MMQVRTLGVVGAGQMGTGIAQVCAQAWSWIGRKCGRGFYDYRDEGRA